jgi:hypothetical protein
MRFLSPRLHGVLDYVAAVVLVLAPFGLGFWNTNLFAAFLSLAVALALLVYSLITDYSYSISGAISFRIHLVFDTLLGLLSIAAPFIFGFTGLVRIYYVVMGVGVLLVVTFTHPAVEDEHLAASAAAD